MGRTLSRVGRIVIFSRLEAVAGRRDDLVAAFAALHDAVVDEPGTAVFAMHTAAEEPDVFFLYEVYDDEAALARHRAGTAVRDVLPRLEGLLARPPEVTYAAPVRVRGVSGP